MWLSHPCLIQVWGKCSSYSTLIGSYFLNPVRDSDHRNQHKAPFLEVQTAQRNSDSSGDCSVSGGHNRCVNGWETGFSVGWMTSITERNYWEFLWRRKCRAYNMDLGALNAIHALPINENWAGGEGKQNWKSRPEISPVHYFPEVQAYLLFLHAAKISVNPLLRLYPENDKSFGKCFALFS